MHPCCDLALKFIASQQRTETLCAYMLGPASGDGCPQAEHTLLPCEQGTHASLCTGSALLLSAQPVQMPIQLLLPDALSCLCPPNYHLPAGSAASHYWATNRIMYLRL